MTFDQPHPRDASSTPTRRRQLALTAASLAIFAAAGLGAIITGNESDDGAVANAAPPDPSPQPTDTQTADGSLPDLAMAEQAQSLDKPDVDDEPERADGGCTIGAPSLRLGAQGDGVRCLQDALREAGHLSGETSGVFDEATQRAVLAFQTAEELFVDGVVGR